MGSGDDAAAAQVLAELQARAATQYVAAFDLAIAEHALGRHENALAFLERAVDERSVWLVWAKQDPLLDAMRGDERYAVAFARMNGGGI